MASLDDVVNGLAQSMPRDRTSTHLVAVLQTQAPSPAVAAIIKNALELQYDDFASPHALPKLTLMHDLTAAGLPEVARHVREGMYD